MKYSFCLSLCLVNIICLTGCKNDYAREEGCHLDKMGIKGNVVKVETIVQSSMPLTEMYAKVFDPKYALTTYGLNISIDFDNHGNVNNIIGYGLDGETLFKGKEYIPDDNVNCSPCVIITPSTKGKVNRIKSVYNEEGQVVNVKYYSNDQLIWNQKASYNEDGTINTIIKEYESLKIHIGHDSITYADTTTYKYSAYDNFHNWVEAEILYKGILPRDTHLVKMKRQITYFQEDAKPKLIEELKSYNNIEFQSCNKVNDIQFSHYGEIEVPHYMTEESENVIQEVQNQIPSYFEVQQKFLFLSTYDDKDMYAFFSINLISGNDFENFDDMTLEELEYDKEMDKYIKEQNTYLLAQSQVYILKWIPYRFVTLAGKRALRVCYYRYGIGSPIPVYCENYTIPMKDGNIININYSYQSNLEFRFKKDFDNAIKSVKFY